MIEWKVAKDLFKVDNGFLVISGHKDAFFTRLLRFSDLSVMLIAFAFKLPII